MRAAVKRVSQLTVAFALVCGAAGPAASTSDDAIYMRVVGVEKNDVLKIREWPSPKSRIIDVIQPGENGIRFYGERRGDWVFVQHGATEGWVHNRYVVPEIASWISRGRRLN